MKSCLKLNATMVANEFIDKYMAGANGEYVKVYLYILRHEGQVRDVGQIADALDHTESDVKRAVGYWVRLGVLEEESVREAAETGAGSYGGQEKAGAAAGQVVGAPTSGNGTTGDDVGRKTISGAIVSDVGRKTVSGAIGSDVGRRASSGNGGNDLGRRTADNGFVPEPMPGYVPSAGKREAGVSSNTPGEQARPVKADPSPSSPRKTYTPEQVSRLADQEDFTQLLYISQKYMDKIFTPRECEVFAYLYDALHMSVELLEYLVEYCVQNGHCSIRYLESVAINWHEKGFRTVDEAKAYTSTFSKEGFAVMRAFGISDRRPGNSEQEMIRRWFREFGFTKDIVLEACNRTLKAIHKPSFSYADKILTDWKKGGVRVMADIQKMDQQRERDNKRGGKAGAAVKPAKNQFHNFEQRNTDYDAMVIERLKERLGDS